MSIDLERRGKRALVYTEEKILSGASLKRNPNTEKYEVQDGDIHSVEFLIRGYNNALSLPICSAGEVLESYSSEEILRFMLCSASFVSDYPIQINILSSEIPSLHHVLQGNRDLSNIIFEIREDFSLIKRDFNEVLSHINDAKALLSDISFSLDDFEDVISLSLEKGMPVNDIISQINILLKEVVQVKFALQKYCTLPEKIQKNIQKQVHTLGVQIVFEQIEFATHESIKKIYKDFKNPLFQKYEGNDASFFARKHNISA